MYSKKSSVSVITRENERGQEAVKVKELQAAVYETHQ
jgi:hypothetical protein